MTALAHGDVAVLKNCIDIKKLIDNLPAFEAFEIKKRNLRGSWTLFVVLIFLRVSLPLIHVSINHVGFLVGDDGGVVRAWVVTAIRKSSFQIFLSIPNTYRRW